MWATIKSGTKTRHVNLLHGSVRMVAQHDPTKTSYS